jgi:hypothetical protein
MVNKQEYILYPSSEIEKKFKNKESGRMGFQRSQHLFKFPNHQMGMENVFH